MSQVIQLAVFPSKKNLVGSELLGVIHLVLTTQLYITQMIEMSRPWKSTGSWSNASFLSFYVNYPLLLDLDMENNEMHIFCKCMCIIGIFFHTVNPHQSIILVLHSGLYIGLPSETLERVSSNDLNGCNKHLLDSCKTKMELIYTVNCVCYCI